MVYYNFVKIRFAYCVGNQVEIITVKYEFEMDPFLINLWKGDIK